MKVKGPLMSMKAIGSFDCITFKDVNLEGNKHMTVAHLKNKRKKPVTNKKTNEAFKAAVSLWKELTPEEKELWDKLEYENKDNINPWQAELSGYHRMVRTNVKLLFEGKDMMRKPG
jgi:spore cortex formation protein SpoVR/YcgB (stage V sporulation)